MSQSVSQSVNQSLILGQSDRIFANEKIDPFFLGEKSNKKLLGVLKLFSGLYGT